MDRTRPVNILRLAIVAKSTQTQASGRTGVDRSNDVRLHPEGRDSSTDGERVNIRTGNEKPLTSV